MSKILHEGRTRDGKLRPKYLKLIREGLARKDPETGLPLTGKDRTLDKGVVMTTADCAALVHTGERNWRKWEQAEGMASARNIPEAEYELFCHKIGIKYPARFNERQEEI